MFKFTLSRWRCGSCGALFRLVTWLLFKTHMAVTLHVTVGLRQYTVWEYATSALWRLDLSWHLTGWLAAAGRCRCIAPTLTARGWEDKESCLWIHPFLAEPLLCVVYWREKRKQAGRVVLFLDVFGDSPLIFAYRRLLWGHIKTSGVGVLVSEPYSRLHSMLWVVGVVLSAMHALYWCCKNLITLCDGPQREQLADSGTRN